MKQFDVKDIKSWSNCDEVKVGDEGYFAENLDTLNERVNDSKPSKIAKIIPSDMFCFSSSSNGCGYGLFLPADKVKDVKVKHYIPIKTITDLYAVLDKKYYSSNFNLPHLVTIRKKIDLTVIYDTAITGWARRDNTIKYIYMNGSWCLRTDELLKDFEIKINGKWLPFGVEE